MDVTKRRAIQRTDPMKEWTNEMAKTMLQLQFSNKIQKLIHVPTSLPQ